MSARPSTIGQQGTNANARSLPTVGVAQRFSQTKDRQTNDLQRAARAANSRSDALPFGNGNVIRNISFTAGTPVIVPHHLGAPYAGYFLTRVYPGAGFPVLAEVAQAANLNALQVTLTSGFTAVADVYVFANG